MAKVGRPKKNPDEALGAAWGIRLDKKSQEALELIEEACRRSAVNGETLTKNQIIRKSLAICSKLLRQRKIKAKDFVEAQ